MSAGLKIILYLVFIVCLFSIDNLIFLCAAGALLSLTLFIMVPMRFILRGWLPISVLLLFTFWSNLLFQYGKVLFVAGPFLVTDAGLTDASIKTVRLVLMIGGAKLLTGTTRIASLTGALAQLLAPLQRVGVPVNEFVSTMGLTMQSLPALKEQFLSLYRESILRQDVRGFWNRARIISGFLLPLFAKSINAPEEVLKQNEIHDKV